MSKIPFLPISFIAMISTSDADWVDDVGLTRLRQELGANAPSGQGISVTQSEAPDGVNYYPQAGSGVFAGINNGNGLNYTGITFDAQSGAQGASNHASLVARRFYEQSRGISPKVSRVYLYTASDYQTWLATALNNRGQVHNSSWIASGTGTQTLIDNADRASVNRDFLHCVGVNNGSGNPLPEVFSHAYNVLSVGLASGNHSFGKTSNMMTGGGRMKPELVSTGTATSFATADISACAALLFQVATENAALSAANDPNAIRAILLAGAQKDFKVSWKRLIQTEPFDRVYGAGQVNVFHSYHILKGGPQTASDTNPSALRAWATPNSLNRQRFLLRVPEGSLARQASFALSWMRQQDGRDTGIGTEQRDDLHLILYWKNAQGTLVEIDRSSSPVDNSQHIFKRHLPAGDYVIEVPAVSFRSQGQRRGHNFALAWNVELGNGPQVTSSANASLQFSDLDPAASYNIERSTDLQSTNWQNIGNLPAADRFSATFTDPSPLPEKAFYRLRWSVPGTPASL